MKRSILLSGRKELNALIGIYRKEMYASVRKRSIFLPGRKELHMLLLKI